MHPIQPPSKERGARNGVFLLSVHTHSCTSHEAQIVRNTAAAALVLRAVTILDDTAAQRHEVPNVKVPALGTHLTRQTALPVHEGPQTGSPRPVPGTLSSAAHPAADATARNVIAQTWWTCYWRRTSRWTPSHTRAINARRTEVEI